MSEKTDELSGRCACGALRYRVSEAPLLVEYCHCETCRRAVGAPLMAWAAFRRSAFEWLGGEATPFKSSSSVTRTFCGCCGTSMTLADERFADDIYVAIASLDAPHALVPEFHIWRSDRLSWLETADQLPRYLRFRYEGLSEEPALES